MFSKQTLRFLEAADHQTPQWLASNKEDYQRYVRDPQWVLLDDLTTPMLAVVPNIVGTASRLVASDRFHRGPVFLRGKIWVTFAQRSLPPEERPAFFFELSPFGYRYGMGFYSATSKKMARVRSAIDRDLPKFEELIKLPPSVVVAGEKYQRRKAPDLAPDVAEWYERKSLYVSTDRAIDDIVLSDRLASTLLTSWTAVVGLYRFLAAA
jgi:hypothetical protein